MNACIKSFRYNQHGCLGTLRVGGRAEPRCVSSRIAPRRGRGQRPQRDAHNVSASVLGAQRVHRTDTDQVVEDTEEIVGVEEVHGDPTMRPDLIMNQQSSRRDVALSLSLACSASFLLQIWPAFAAAPASSVGTSTFVSKNMGFQFSYPSSFVVAFDRTESYLPRNIPADQDVALTSIGSYTKSFLTVTVFAKRVGANDTPGAMGTKDFFYERVIQPVVDSPTTIGFSLTSESTSGGGKDSYYDFEFIHRVCRGETIEGKAGLLRCIGNFGQDLPIQSRVVVGRSIVQGDLLLTVMGSIRTEGGDVDGAMEEERRIVQGIVQTFGSS